MAVELALDFQQIPGLKRPVRKKRIGLLERRNRNAVLARDGVESFTWLSLCVAHASGFSTLRAETVRSLACARLTPAILRDAAAAEISADSLPVINLKPQAARRVIARDMVPPLQVRYGHVKPVRNPFKGVAALHAVVHHARHHRYRRHVQQKSGWHRRVRIEMIRHLQSRNGQPVPPRNV